ncbi:MAG TPA: hypothetical protein VGC01_01640 [Mucilaginibacter sp.]
MKKSIFILIAVVIVIIGCKIDKTGIPAPTSNTTLNGTWYLKSEIIITNFAGFAEYPEIITNFTTKDFYKFNPDFTVNISSSDTTGTITNYYSFNTTSSGQTIVIGNASTPAGINYTVNKLTKDSLVMNNIINEANSGINVITNTTLKFAH